MADQTLRRGASALPPVTGFYEAMVELGYDPNSNSDAMVARADGRVWDLIADRNRVTPPPGQTDVYAEALVGLARSSTARWLVALADRVDRQASALQAECLHPPCQHADGIRLAVAEIRKEAERVLHR